MYRKDITYVMYMVPFLKEPYKLLSINRNQ